MQYKYYVAWIRIRQVHEDTICFQVAAHNLFFGANIKQAIDYPRIHNQLYPNVTRIEKEFSPVGRAMSMSYFDQSLLLCLF